MSLDELDERPNHKKKVIRQMIHFKKPFDKKIMFNGLKCLALGVNHMCRK
jgi:hypothetical protein